MFRLRRNEYGGPVSRPRRVQGTPGPDHPRLKRAVEAPTVDKPILETVAGGNLHAHFAPGSKSSRAPASESGQARFRTANAERLYGETKKSTVL